MACLDTLIDALDVDHDNGITYDEFQLGVLRDADAAAILDTVIRSASFKRCLAHGNL